uniref:non-specific serine/threonine protein kinase n=1 Tax=Leersia perrieri TaxID=77586 RepID=A0A0D9XVL0_9ORYZ
MALPPHCHCIIPFFLLTIATVLLLSLSTTTTVVTAAEEDHRSNVDLAALLAFKAQVSDPLGVLRDGWREDNSNSSSLCHWIGVSCSRRRQRVTALVLPDTPLHGSITPHLGNLSFLSVLNLTNTSLTGNIPSELGMLSRLKNLELRRNTLSGSIPSTIGNLTRLEYLMLDRNQLSGQIPSELQNLQNLVHINLQGNYLSGHIPDIMFNGSSSVLSFINLGNNSLSGPIPIVIASLPMLRVLVIQFNQLSGTLPPNIFNMSRLELLYAAGNNLTGPIPFPAGNQSSSLPMIHLIALPQNKFTGRIPPALAACRTLKILDLGMNRIADHVPEWLAGLSQLNFLSLTGNDITGSIPAELSNLTMLTVLQLSNCKLSGTIPMELGKMTQLTVLLAQENRLTGPFPAFIGTNNLTGTIPATISNLTNLNAIRLSDNQISGTIPDSLMLMEKLQGLYLSMNSLFGPIPSQIGNFQSINSLYLNNNNFSGSIPKGDIPKYFANLTYLTSLNLSFNNLQGQIPSGGVFQNIGLQSLMGNARLCGAPLLGFSPCHDNSHSTSKNHFLKYVLPAAIVAFGAIVVFLFLKIVKKMKKPESTASFDIADAISHRLVSYQEIVRATKNFNEDNLLGVGSFGKVFKGRLDDGLLVAIEVLSTQVEHAMRTFDAECHVLRMARHRNLIKIMNTCSNLDFRALLLQLMPNGSLESYLHSESSPCVGSFLKRIEIMLDVSMAMEYLHHDHYEVVVHCDLKPSNVLFDEEMTAHVADFSIAKLLLGEDNLMLSASMAGTIGYMAPEYAHMGKASRKSDVFSFGIMLLEVFTGKRPTDPMFIDGLTLRQWVSQSFPENLADVTDKNLLQDEETWLFFDHQHNSLGSSSTSRSNSFLMSIFELGLVCSSGFPEQRMAMNDVVTKLKHIKKDYSASLLAMQRPRQH